MFGNRWNICEWIGGCLIGLTFCLPAPLLAFQKHDVSTRSSRPLKPDNSALDSTHSQTAAFKPQVDGKVATLVTFRVRQDDGCLVVCVAATKASNSPGYVQVYSKDLELMNETALEYAPSAMDLDVSGNVFVAGSGRLAKVSRDGEIVSTNDSPTAGGDLEQQKAEIRKSLEQQSEQLKSTFGKQVEMVSEQIAEIEANSEADQADKDKRKLKQLKARLKSYQQVLERQVEVTDAMVESRLNASTRITSVAVTESDLFIATSARSGSGYEIYRMDHDMNGARMVLGRLRGCCGHMDVHAMGDRLYVAENTKFQVGVYDFDGKSLVSFGERLSGKNLGFGSCCNPMNIDCCANGDVLTAESNVGKIKRFNSEGEMVGYVGQAKIGTGCRNVVVSFDEQHNRYYVQNHDANEICVLTANSGKSSVQE